MELTYEQFKPLVMEHPDKSKFIKILRAIDESVSPATTRPIINRQIRTSTATLDRMLYFLDGVHAIASQSVGRAQAYALTSTYGGRLLDELKGGDSDA